MEVVQLMDAAVVADPSLVLRGITEVARIRSLYTWGALLLAAVAAFGSIVRTLRRTVRWLRRHRQRVVIASWCGGGGGSSGIMAGSIVPEPSFDFTDDDSDDETESEESVGSEESEEEEDEPGESEDDVRESESSFQDWGFGSGGWDSWFGGNVVRHWDEELDQDDDDKTLTTNNFFSLVSPSSGFVPLIKSAFSLQLDTPSLTLSCSDNDGLDLSLWDSRLRSCVPAAVIDEAGRLRRRPAAGVRVGGHNKLVYVAEKGGGGTVVDLRNTRSVIRVNGGKK